MGKRSTQTTKSGKYMNPTDQARKEARRRELKKNKKQRQMVRQAVLKGKNPRDLIVELEKIDDMEYNPLAPPPLNAKVLNEKRRKLVETWNRVVQLYEKEDPQQFTDLRKVWSNYLMRKSELMSHCEAVRNAQNVHVDEIPLPNSLGPSDMPTTDIPLPPLMQPKHGILKRSSVLDTLRPKTCPGVPLGPPPQLSDYVEEADEKSSEKKTRKIRFAEADDETEPEPPKADEDEPKEEHQNANAEQIEATTDEQEEPPIEKPKVDDLQRRMLAMAGQDVDAYLKEMEKVHRQTQAEKAKELQSRMEAVQQKQQQTRQEPPNRPGAVPPGPPPGAPPGPPMGAPPGNPPNFGPPGVLIRPGVPPPGVRLPPGPPPGRPPLRMPPGPPPGIPPSLSGARLPPMPRPLAPPPTRAPGVVSAAPQIIQKDSTVSGGQVVSAASSGGSVIEAKPQMRNLLSDVTRFVPTRVIMHKKDEPGHEMKKLRHEPKQDIFMKHSQPQPLPNKDDAYAQFMKEMEGIMK